MNKKQLMAVGIVLTAIFTVGFLFGKVIHKQKTTFSILGDSISTYEGVTPAEYYSYYPKDALDDGNDLSQLSDMWFSIYSKKTGAKLVENNSAAGSMIIKGEDNPGKPSISERVDELRDPDVLFIFGGINDYWEGVSLNGEFLPAFEMLLDSLKQKYPKTNIVYIAYSELPQEWKEEIHDSCDENEAGFIELPKVSMVSGHPDKEGMKIIGEYVADYMRQN